MIFQERLEGCRKIVGEESLLVISGGRVLVSNLYWLSIGYVIRNTADRYIHKTV